MALNDTLRGKRIGKALYALLFNVAIPAGLILWARATRDIVRLPPVRGEWEGALIAALGLSLLLAGMYAVVTWGKGLPMNMYPPPDYVSRGVFRFIRNPIYAGFVVLCVGVSVMTASASGLWLVTPMVAAALAALVLGYERHDLARRFGDATVARPLLSIPCDSSVDPTPWDRISTFVIAFFTWSIAFEAVYRLGVPPDAIEAYLPFERGWPVIQWTEAVYTSIYLFVGAIPFVLRSQRELRRFTITGLVATVFVTLIYLTVPIVAPPRPFVPDSFLGRMLEGERWMSHTVGAFPSFHVIWTLIAAEAWTRHSRKLAPLAWAWALAISASCITTGMHALADIVFAAALFLLIRSYKRVWETLRSGTERIANSWREWQFGNVRILNHGAYAAAGGGLGLLIALTLAGPNQFWGVVIVGLLALFGAALWAQRLEGASGLSRPFGFYGALFGGSVGCLVVGLLGYDVFLLFAAFAMCAPWAQSVGRLRCLVQGCCHGAPTTEYIGIRYHMPRSRVLEKGKLGGVPLHPTPLYSILTNTVIGLLLIRMWSLGASLGIIVGVYFVLNGLSRFVEESYRGEPQTPIVGGMRIYQWTAIVSVLIGVAFTIFPAVFSVGFAHAPTLPTRAAVVSAILFALFCGFAMGVDFPRSNRRFARLASA